MAVSLTAMTRADRRARTEKVKTRRHRDWCGPTLKHCDCSPSQVGQMRSKAHFDCGHSHCSRCNGIQGTNTVGKRVRVKHAAGPLREREVARLAALDQESLQTKR